MSTPEIVREAAERRQIVTRFSSLHKQAKALLEERGREVVVGGEDPHVRLEYTCTLPVEGDLPIEVTFASLRYKGSVRELIEESKTVFIEVGEVHIALRSDPHGSVIRDKGTDSITHSDLDACSELIEAVINTGR